MRALRWAFLAVLAAVLVTLALANRGLVTLRLLPDGAGSFLGLQWSIELPLFLVIFAGILLGLLFGFVWEWMREARLRSAASQTARDKARLERELARVSADAPAQSDDVLALLEKPARAR
ncbi:MAG: LapA family protein [Phaeovulum sp.]|nr:LapA family protein [Phaeovulum sp.]MDP1670032.1 LapA family protein [Phaeovulum sp.]MDP2061756.1 LapA family protein [Phaeovulum sp.]MDP3860053.1 LapA family protein [Phaeovulum sp.]